MAHARKTEWGDAEITEVAGSVALSIYTNYFNHVARTEVDFSCVSVLATHLAGSRLHELQRDEGSINARVRRTSR